MKTLIAIPCYNCEKQVERLMERLKTTEFPQGTDVLFVDNKSLDRTATVIGNNLQENFTLILHKENYGLGGSFKTICQYAWENSYAYIVLLHGDDQASVSDLKELLKKIPEDWDCIFGARFMPGSTLHNYSLVRRLGNQGINFLYSLILRRRIYEIGSGLNAYKVASLPLEEIKLYPTHIAFDINLLFHFTQMKYRTLFMPIEWSETDQRSNASNVKVGFKVISMLLLHLLGKVEKTSCEAPRSWEIIR